MEYYIGVINRKSVFGIFQNSKGERVINTSPKMMSFIQM